MTRSPSDSNNHRNSVKRIVKQTVKANKTNTNTFNKKVCKNIKVAKSCELPNEQEAVYRKKQGSEWTGLRGEMPQWKREKSSWAGC